VSLYKVGGFCFVPDGHRRVSVARYHGVERIDVYVTEIGPSGKLWSHRTRDTECA
jgi:ParB-like chromosome segregation protein Spo0J